MFPCCRRDSQNGELDLSYIERQLNFCQQKGLTSILNLSRATSIIRPNNDSFYPQQTAFEHAMASCISQQVDQSHDGFGSNKLINFMTLVMTFCDVKQESDIARNCIQRKLYHVSMEQWNCLSSICTTRCSSGIPSSLEVQHRCLVSTAYIHQFLED